jgi:nitroreductase
METWDAIRARRNVREFADTPVSGRDLDRILEAGRLAPSASNWQPWDFVVVVDRDQLVGLSGIWPGAGHSAGAAAAIVIVCPVQHEARKRDLLEFDVGQATMSMMIAAADLGIGTGHSSIGDQDLARSLLGFPEDRFAAYFFSLGYPRDRPLAPLARMNRRAFDEVVHRGRW